MDVDEENLVEKLRLENETLKTCMSKFEREWNAALSSLGINVPQKESATVIAEPSENAPNKEGDALDASSQPLHSLATLIAAASHLTPQ
jgi:hypothetical protein